MVKSIACCCDSSSLLESPHGDGTYYLVCKSCNACLSPCKCCHSLTPWRPNSSSSITNAWFHCERCGFAIPFHPSPPRLPFDLVARIQMCCVGSSYLDLKRLELNAAVTWIRNASGENTATMGKAERETLRLRTEIQTLETLLNSSSIVSDMSQNFRNPSISPFSSDDAIFTRAHFEALNAICRLSGECPRECQELLSIAEDFLRKRSKLEEASCAVSQNVVALDLMSSSSLFLLADFTKSQRVSFTSSVKVFITLLPRINKYLFSLGAQGKQQQQQQRDQNDAQQEKPSSSTSKRQLQSIHEDESDQSKVSQSSSSTESDANSKKRKNETAKVDENNNNTSSSALLSSLPPAPAPAAGSPLFSVHGDRNDSLFAMKSLEIKLWQTLYVDIYEICGVALPTMKWKE